MLNSRDIPYVREDRLHNEMRALSEKKKLFDGSNEGFAIRPKGNSEEASTIRN